MKILTAAGPQNFSDLEAAKRHLNELIERELGRVPSIWKVLALLNVVAQKIAPKRAQVASFLALDQMMAKLTRELGSDFEGELRAEARNRGLLEGFRPLGVLCHITAGNDVEAPFLAVIEGLLTGNINLVKLASGTSPETLELFNELFLADSEGLISGRIILCEFKGSDEAAAKLFYSFADGVSAWGGEDALRSIRAELPIGVRFIPWGHRLSFAYLASELTPDLMDKLLHDIELYAQQACSAPQTLFVEGDWERAKLVARELFHHAQKRGLPALDLALDEQAEITNFVLLKKVEMALGETEVWGDQLSSHRLIAERGMELKSSPLNKTLIVIPIERKRLYEVLRPHRTHLQTVGLEANAVDLISLSDTFFALGASRVTPWGRMQESYAGEPHDGEIALRRFLKRVRAEHPLLTSYAKWSEGKETTPVGASKNLPIATKQDFARVNEINANHRFVFKSGGSSGVQAISPFSYADYHRQMSFAADGLLAAGFEPERDRVINLFFGGLMYGGFLSFTDILEKVDALQFPMAAVNDLDYVGQNIVHFKIDTLMGMPSYLYSLFKHNEAMFKNYRGIKKIFYGGEFLPQSVRDWYQSEFGVELIKSASYGSVDAGPVAYQCAHSEGGVHHLHSSLHELEIVALESDEPVQEQETGRLIYSTPSRLSTKVERYELGDIGRWVLGQCPCGHRTPRFELQGRVGDIFRAGGNFFNFQKFEKFLRSEFKYEGLLQVLLSKVGGLDQLILYSEPSLNTSTVRVALLNYERDLRIAVMEEGTLLFEVQALSPQAFRHGAGSGKTLRVIDERSEK